QGSCHAELGALSIRVRGGTAISEPLPFGGFGLADLVLERAQGRTQCALGVETVRLRGGDEREQGGAELGLGVYRDRGSDIRRLRARNADLLRPAEEFVGQ